MLSCQLRFGHVPRANKHLTAPTTTSHVNIRGSGIDHNTPMRMSLLGSRRTHLRWPLKAGFAAGRIALSLYSHTVASPRHSLSQSLSHREREEREREREREQNSTIQLNSYEQPIPINCFPTIHNQSGLLPFVQQGIRPVLSQCHSASLHS